MLRYSPLFVRYIIILASKLIIQHACDDREIPANIVVDGGDLCLIVVPNKPVATSSRSEIIDEEEHDCVAAEEENSPIEQVALTVPITDDPSIPVLTFRMWVLGTMSCVILSFLNQFFWYRKEPLTITSISAQIAVVPLGHLMANTITSRVFFKGKRCEFTLNPGPFNVKEHVLITIFANSGAGSVYAIHIVSAVKVFYKQTISFFVALLVVLTTQVPSINI